MSFSAESSWYASVVQATLDEVMRTPSEPERAGGRSCACTRCLVERSVSVAAPLIVEGVLQGLAEIRRDV